MGEDDAARDELDGGCPRRECSGEHVPTQAVPQCDTGPELGLRERDVCSLLAAWNRDVLPVWAMLARVSAVAGIARVSCLPCVARLPRLAGISGLPMLSRLTALS